MRSARSIRAKRLERAVGRLAVGVMGKRLRLPVAVGERARIVGDVAQARVHMLAHPLERLLVEPRRVDREPQQLGGAIEVLGQRAHPPAPMVAVAMERHLDRLLVERPVKALRIEFARALVEEPRHQRAEAGLVGRVLRRAAAHGEFERHQRHRIGADEPQREAARGRDDVDVDGGMGRRKGEVLLHGRFHFSFCRLGALSARRRNFGASYAASLSSGSR